MSQVRSVLLIKPGSLGDIVHALPAISYLRATWSDVSIRWIVDTRWQPLLANIPGIDETIPFPRENFRGWHGGVRFFDWLRNLSNLQPSLTIDLQGLLRSGLMARFSKAENIVGGSDAREGARWFYQTLATVNPNAHAVDRYRSILAAAGVNTDASPQFPLGNGEALSPPLEPGFILLHPYARGKDKSLLPHQVNALLQALTPLRVVVAGMGVPLLEKYPHVTDLLHQTTLQQFVWLARHASAVVSVDSGPAHIAAAVNPRVLSIHTWSDPRKVGPYQETAHIWQGGSIRKQDLRLDRPLPPSIPFPDTAILDVSRWIYEQQEIASSR